MSNQGVPGVTTGPYQYLTPQGVIVPDTADIQTSVNEIYEEALGADIDLDPETPQGSLAAVDVNAFAAVVANNAAVANQINPNISGGIFLQSICALTGVDVPEASPTLILGVSVAGQPNVPIPAGSIAGTLDSNNQPTGDQFRTTEQVTLGPDGTATVDLESVEDGPIACPQGSLRKIVSDVLGWETVNNSATGTLGTLAPSDVQLRQARNNKLALQGSALSEAITSAVNDVPGVLGPCAFRQNDEKFDQTIDGIFLKANSIWVCAQGGADVDVANAIRIAKSGGCAYNGAVTIYITDPASGQLCPVSFDRPTAIPIICQITCVLPNTTFTAADVQQALLDYGAGLINGQAGFVSGQPVSPWDMASGPTTEIPGIQIKNLQVGLKSGGGLSTSAINMGLNQIPSLALSDITVIATT